MEEFFPQNENLKTVLCRPSVKKSQNCGIFFWGYYGRTITRAEFTGMMIHQVSLDITNDIADRQIISIESMAESKKKFFFSKINKIYI